MLFWVSDLTKPAPGFFEKFLFGCIVVGSCSCYVGTILDGSPITSVMVGGFALCCFPGGYRVMYSFREKLTNLPGRDMHVKRAIFVGGVAALIPLTYLMFDSANCITNVFEFWKIHRR